MTADETTRRELDQLTGWLSRMERRIEGIDQSGTRGMGAVIVQIADLAKDVGQVAGEQRAWERAHDEAHRDDEARRVTGRRWLITLGLTNAVAVLGPWLAVLVTRH